MIGVDHHGQKARNLAELKHDYLLDDEDDDDDDDDDDCGKPIPECNGAIRDVLVLMSGSKVFTKYR